MDCPKPILNLKLNLENRNRAIKDFGYGAPNPLLENTEFWQKKADLWGVSIDEAKTMRCGNCAAFDVRKKIKDCIAKGFDDGYETIDAGELGYCRALKFKCASKRTCDIWIVGGAITDKKVNWFFYGSILLITLIILFFIIKKFFVKK